MERKYTLLIHFSNSLLFMEMLNDLMDIDVNDATPDHYPVHYQDRVKLANTLTSIILMSGYLNNLRVRFIKSKANCEIKGQSNEIHLPCRTAEITALYIAICLAKIDQDAPHYLIARDVHEQMIRGSWINAVIGSIYKIS